MSDHAIVACTVAHRLGIEASLEDCEGAVKELWDRVEDPEAIREYFERNPPKGWGPEE